MEENKAQALQEFSPSIAHGIAPSGYTGTFSTIRQGNLTNTLTKARARKDNTAVDRITGAATLTQGDLVITYPQLQGLQGLKTSTYRLLDAITVTLTESGAKSPTVTLSLEEYMMKCGLKDRKEARKQASADLEALFNARVTFKEKPRRRGKKAEAEPDGFMDMRICQTKGISRSGIITFGFSDTFYKILLGYPVMPYPPQLWTLSAKRNPNSYYLLRKISELKNMNAGKKNEDTIAVKTLLGAAPFIPSYDEVMETDRALTRKIIEPFERDMDALEETLTWEYCHANGLPLTDTEAGELDYTIFTGLNVRVHWRTYPDQTARLEAKTERIRAAKKRSSSRKKSASAPAEEIEDTDRTTENKGSGA